MKGVWLNWYENNLFNILDKFQLNIKQIFFKEFS